MSESPWNAKARRRRAPQPLNPQGAKAPHVPQRPPSTERPKARISRRGLAARRKEQERQRFAPQQAQAGGRQPREGRRPIPKALVIALAALTLVLAVSGILYSARQQRYDSLLARRRLEEEQLLAHRMEHLNARENSGFLPLISKYAREYNINPSFISAIIKCESSYRPDVSSRVDARGLMQIMPDTGTWLAGRLNISNYQGGHLFDPETNIRFGAYYLAYLSDMFGGNPVMVASAYHAGANNVKHWALGRAEDMKTIRLDQIPMDDTRSYVRKVMDAYAIYYENDQGGPAAGAGLVPPAVPGGRAGQ